MKDATPTEALREQPSQRQLFRIVAAFVVALISVSTLSLLSVGYLASRSADSQAAATELTLFHNVMKSHEGLMAQDTYSMVHWDDAVQGIAIAFDPDFVRDTFIYSLAHDYGQQRTFLIDPQGRMVASARGDQVDMTLRDLPAGSDFAIITGRAVEAHMRHRIAVGDVFSQKAVNSNEIREISAFSFAMVDGGPAIVVAMAVVPGEETVVMPEGKPYILISARPIDQDLIRDLNAQLSFADLTFRSADNGTVDILSASGQMLGSFVWASARPGTHIWSVIVPVVLILLLLFVVAGALVMRHVGGLSSRLVASERRIRHLALHDPLSGLANRRQFEEALAAAVETGKPFAQIACDLDRFKAVNDGHGHAAGDQVIKVVAGRLSEIVAGNGLVGRIGGDEFVILVTGFCDQERLTLLAAQIRMTIGLPILLESGAAVDVGISIGIARFPDCGTTPTAILSAADDALYASKANGRGRATFAVDSDGVALRNDAA